MYVCIHEVMSTGPVILDRLYMYMCSFLILVLGKNFRNFFIDFLLSHHDSAPYIYTLYCKTFIFQAL